MQQNNNRSIAPIVVDSLPDASSIGFTNEALIRWKEQYAAKAPMEDFVKFIEQCIVYGTDPRRKRCFLIPRYDNAAKRVVYGYQIALSGLIGLAQVTGEFEGFTDVFFCAKDGVWRDTWPMRPTPGKPETYPWACKVGVYRKGFRKELNIVRYFHEVAYKINRDTGKEEFISDFWQKMPLLMVAKCVKSQCVREGFEEKAGSLYIPEEMHTNNQEMEYAASLMVEEDRKEYSTSISPVQANAVVDSTPVQEEPTPINDIPSGTQLNEQIIALGWKWDATIKAAFKSVPGINIPALLAKGTDLSPTQCKRVAAYIKFAKEEKQAS